MRLFGYSMLTFTSPSLVFVCAAHCIEKQITKFNSLFVFLDKKVYQLLWIITDPDYAENGKCPSCR